MFADPADSTFSVAAIAGGAAGGVAVIVLIAVVVWLLLRKWRLQKHKSHVHQAKDDDDFEEHENPLYGTEDETEPIPQSTSKPFTVIQLCTPNNPDNTAQTPSINSNLHQTATDNDQSTEEYAVVETSKSQRVAAPSDASNTSVTESTHATAVSGSATAGQQDQILAKSENVPETGTKRSAAAGVFEVTLFSNTATPGSSGSLVRVGSDPPSTKQDQKNQDINTALYADPNGEDACNSNPYEFTTDSSTENAAESKPKIQPKPAPSGDVYAVVDKPGAQIKQAQSGDVYAVVDKSRNKPQETTSGDVYAVVDKTKTLPASGLLQKGSPGAPVTNCPQYVYENQVLRCDCQVNASAPVSPGPIVQWKGSDPGQRLVSNIVKRNDTGQVFTCTQMWGPLSDREYLETSYTLDVAYGPDAVNITRLDGMQTTNPNHFTLQCTATGVYPAANFLWSGVTCNMSLPFYPTNLTDGSICRFVATAEDDGKVVTCNVSNSPFPAKSKNATYQVHVTLSSPGTTGTATSTEGHDNQATTTLQTNEVVTGGGIPVPYIAGGAGGAVGIIVVVVVVIIACRGKRRRRQRKDADFEMHVNPIYGSGDDLDAPTTTTTIPSTTTTTVSASAKCTTTIISAPISTASTIQKPSAVALCIPAETSDQTLPNDPEAGDEDDTANVGYSTLSFRRQQVLPPTDSNSVGGIYSHVNEAQANMSMTATPGVGMSSLPVDADSYTSIDDAPCDSDTHQDPGDDGYSTVGFTCNQSLPAPSGDEYAVVNHPESIASESADHNAGRADICDNTYSQVKRDSSRGNTARASISADCSNVRDGDQPACDEDYAVVDKSRTRKGTASTADVGYTETVADVSAKVDKNAEENNSISGDNSPPSVDEYVYAQVDKTSTQNRPATSDNVSLTTKKD
ncbi:uncharacterized protein [Littorina saxatilis]|uniref:uncharacterized protein n=1 Tax=Littorina saxatilis TaxID=31220 RepID=UPI0038B488A9